jgi:hypothetical protein
MTPAIVSHITHCWYCYTSFKTHCNNNLTPLNVDLLHIRIFTDRKPGAFRCMILSSKRCKTHLQASSMSKKFQGPSSGEQRRGERKREGERMEKGGIGLHHFSDQSCASAGKHTSNNRSTTRSTTVLLLVVLNVVCRVQTVTSHQQETVSRNDSRFNHANKQCFAQTAARQPMVGGGGSAARRHRRGADLYE